MSSGQTLPGLLWRNAARWPTRPAWRHKRFGIWQTVTWSAFADRARGIALGLASEGFAAGDRLAVLGDNRPDLYAAMLAAQALGGAAVPLDPDAEPEALAAIVEAAGIGMAITDIPDHAVRLNMLDASLHVWCADVRDEAKDHILEALIAKGRGTQQEPLDALPESLALLLYSNADARPLSLSHSQLIAAAEAIAAADAVWPQDETLSYLPMSSYDDAVYSLALGLLSGCVCNCPEAPDSALRDMREIGPTILVAPPRACTAFAQTVTNKSATATGLKRQVFAWARDTALRAEAAREAGTPVPFGTSLCCRIGDLLACAPVRDQLGLSRTRWVHSSGAAPAEATRLLRALGVPLRPQMAEAPIADAVVQPRETLHV
jgi:long-chain acyl-CoA synthetase